jgi:outer membrane protein TolC
MDDYLAQVKQKNQKLQALEMTYKSKMERKDEAILVFRPSFFINGQYVDDQSPTNAPTFQGNKTLSKFLQTGLSQKLTTGTQLNLSYNMRQVEIFGVNPAFLPNNSFYDLYPQLEVTQSLWKNFGGAQDVAMADVQKHQVQASMHEDHFNYQVELIYAQNVYWRLYFAKMAVNIQRESVERVKKIRNWNKERSQSNLIDETNFLQAEASLQAREIQLQDAQTELNSALLNFNLLLQNNIDDVTLTQNHQPTVESILGYKIPAKTPSREDVLVSQAAMNVARARAIQGVEQNKPRLELYGNYALKGRDSEFDPAYKESWKDEHPYLAVGVRFETPLNVFALERNKDAYAQEKVAAEISHQRKILEVENDWKDVTQRLKFYQERVKLVAKMQEIQKKKLSQERRLYDRGRTTTFQVLQFEQDFADTEIAKISSERELIRLYNEIQLFSETPYAK